MDLESLVERHGPVPAGRVIHILQQACDSLEEAHSHGLVHRDIKPANIHLGCIGLRADFVKVLDFGLVKAPAQNGDKASLATGAGVAVGTPSYMAPEMVYGGAVDGRADLYALGCVAYFLLTGKTPFDAENAFQMIAMHLQAQPIPPSRRTEQEVPAALERIVLSCLAKDPSARPHSASALAHDLASVPVHSWTEEQARSWWRSETEKRDAPAAAVPVRAIGVSDVSVRFADAGGAPVTP
jgi:serine/threonine-protein kinase